MEVSRGRSNIPMGTRGYNYITRRTNITIMKKATIALSILVVVSLALLVTTITSTSSDVTGQECWEKQLLGESCTTNVITVHLEDSLSMTDEVETHIPHPLVGQVVFSEDGSICWEIEEYLSTFYYRMLSDCQNA